MPHFYIPRYFSFAFYTLHSVSNFHTGLQRFMNVPRGSFSILAVSLALMESSASQSVDADSSHSSGINSRLQRFMNVPRGSVAAHRKISIPYFHGITIYSQTGRHSNEQTD